MSNTDPVMEYEGRYTDVFGKSIYIEGMYKRCNIDDSIHYLANELDLSLNELSVDAIKTRLFDEYIDLIVKHIMIAKIEMANTGKVANNG